MCILVALGDVPYYILNQPESVFKNEGEIKISQKFTDVEDVQELFNKAANFDLSKISTLTISRLIITQDHARFVLKMYDRTYFQSMVETAEILVAESDTKNNMSKTIRILQSAPEITKQELLNIIEASLETFKQHAMTNKKTVTGSDAYNAGIAWHKSKINSIQDISDDAKITIMSRPDLIRSTKLTNDNLNLVINTFVDSGDIVEIVNYASRKPKTQYAYIPNYKRVELPEENYIKYIGNGTYSSGVILKNILW